MTYPNYSLCTTNVKGASLVYLSHSVMSWTAAHQTSLSITNSQSLLKLMSIQLVIPSNCLILCHPLLLLLSIFPRSGSFPMSQFFASGGQSVGASASAPVLPINIQDWSPLGWTGLISLLSKGLPKASSIRLSAFCIVPTLTSIHDYWKNNSFDSTNLCQ